jgi:hypothetical protein
MLPEGGLAGEPPAPNALFAHFKVSRAGDHVEVKGQASPVARSAPRASGSGLVHRPTRPEV